MTTLQKMTFLLICSLTMCGQKGKTVFPKNMQAKVVGVRDGDTIDVLYEKQTITIRLAHIDCPEMKNNQPFAKAAKQFTSSNCFGRTVTIQHRNQFDRYKRLIAMVLNDKQENVNLALVRAGLAWHYKKYSTDNEFAQEESKARANRLGLWSADNPTPPWEWQKNPSTK
jgi:micrococcal nuclease